MSLFIKPDNIIAGAVQSNQAQQNEDFDDEWTDEDEEQQVSGTPEKIRNLTEKVILLSGSSVFLLAFQRCKRKTCFGETESSQHGFRTSSALTILPI